jgi:hypothetical protein
LLPGVEVSTEPGHSSWAAGAAWIELIVHLGLGTGRQQLAAATAVLDLSGVWQCRLADIGRAGSPVRNAHAARRAWLESLDDEEVPA